MLSNKRVPIIRFYCKGCRNFEAKFTKANLELLMLPCPKCKKTNLIHIENSKMYIRTVKAKSSQEPEGLMLKTDFDALIDFVKQAEPIQIA